jgi:hypothetical protein
VIYSHICKIAKVVLFSSKLDIIQFHPIRHTISNTSSMIIHIDFSLIVNLKEMQNYLDSLYHNVALEKQCFLISNWNNQSFPFWIYLLS